MPLPVLQPSRVTVMIKPVGALCNLDCTYCYYLPTKAVFDGREHRMSEQTLEAIFAGVLPRFDNDVTIAWQGGEPTLAGLPFFEKAMELQQKYKRPEQRIRHALQTNGTLLDDDWGRFLHKHEYLVGLSVDGPRHFHDHYRLTNRHKPSSDQVMRGLRMLQRHGVEFNILCVLNDINVQHPDEVLDYLLNLGTKWLQFIPAIEWIPPEVPPEKSPEASTEAAPGHPRGNRLAPFAPDGKAYGTFLCRVFDRWFERYRHKISVRIFDAVLNRLVLGEMPFCILDASCHNQLTIEHDGSIFGCDHFVERRWQVGKIGDREWQNPIRIDGSQDVGLTVHGGNMRKADDHAGLDIHEANDMQAYKRDDAAEVAQDHGWLDRVDDGRLGAFAVRKQHLPDACRVCEWKPYCHGGCPKHRPHGGDLPEPSILCEGYKTFFTHAMPKFQWLAGFLRENRMPPPPEAAAGAKSRKRQAAVSRNAARR